MKENYEVLEDKYIELLLKRCLNFDKSKSLFLSYDKVNKRFADKVISYAKNMGVLDIGIDCEDIYERHEKLKNIKLEDIEKDSYFDKSNWDIYAKKDASFLMLESEFPGVMDDIDPKKIAKAKFTNRKTRELFREKELKNEIPWCIAAIPNQVWADKIFKNDPNSLEKLYDVIFKMCMVDTLDPILSWNNYIKEVDIKIRKLNDLKITKLHYTNSLGTDLYIEMPEYVIWRGVGSGSEKNMIVNMPSYEIFSSPNYLKTEGIVYSSKPLFYGGAVVNDFYLKFKEGKVVDFNAKEGYEILKGIIESDSNSCYLGEVALVDYDSPISNTKLVFGTTLFDENASCHLALGEAFSDTIPDGSNMSREELLKNGLNVSSNHVDFMIGTSDLVIEAETKDGLIKLFDKGNFTI